MIVAETTTPAGLDLYSHVTMRTKEGVGIRAPFLARRVKSWDNFSPKAGIL